MRLNAILNRERLAFRVSRNETYNRGGNQPRAINLHCIFKQSAISDVSARSLQIFTNFHTNGNYFAMNVFRFLFFLCSLGRECQIFS